MEEGDLVLCTVEQIDGTTVFVSLPDGKKGTIITSEIAPGRIKNIREYVAINKKIVCKVLRINNKNIELSLRRVTLKEKKEIMDAYNQEQQAISILKQALKEQADEIEKKILSKFSSLSEFMLKARENISLIKENIPEKFQDNLEKIIQKRKKEVEVKKIVKLKCISSDGIIKIKRIFHIEDEKTKIVYLSAGTFQISVKAENYKDANKKIEEIANNIEKNSKTNYCEFEAMEK